MGIKEVRDAFVQAAQGQLHCRDCELSTVQDGNNSQRLVIRGMSSDGRPFELDSGPFDPKTSPILKAQSLAQEALAGKMGFQQPPRRAAG